MENNLKKLPPLERKPDGSLHRMTPAQRKRANAFLSADNFFLGLLQAFPLGCPAAGSDAGSRDFPG